ncbi:hypothetical protein J4U01_gp006 [Mycobacterium phage Kumao]|uniref:Uncharacterized protein n=1 Tax=Mycobacterium phage Kumao TaxID=2041344 RepID=A0A2D1GPJ9_9CAUD|nr:hypothetical protein J4U01_gp006 [Mycobacterium phage Kumao]ATN93969.1 hypothetical protein SEA_KUMAO_6 [Mycobacterium phage Kumao]
MKLSAMSTEYLHQHLQAVRDDEESKYPVGTILKLLPHRDDAFVIKVAGICDGYGAKSREETSRSCWVTIFRDFSGDARCTLNEVRQAWPIHDLSIIHMPVDK